MRELEKLKGKKLKTLPVGLHGDGAGLYLQVRDAHARSWILRYMLNGRPRMMGLGSLNDFTLAEAREAATEARKLLHAGKDPIEERDRAKVEAKLAAAATKTFRECCEEYLAAHRAGWRSEKHARQWADSVANHAFPKFGDVAVADITTPVVMSVLGPLWKKTPESASRLRGRIESILDYAKAHGFRAGDNPAAWSIIEHLLPARAKVQKVVHHAALPHKEMAGFMAQLRKSESVTARALEFLILTAARMGEARMARWDEIDFDNALWTLPEARMKAGEEHAVPLAPAVVALLLKQRSLSGGGVYVFPGLKAGEPLGGSAMGWLMDKRLGRGELTIHGFRSTFRDWCSEVAGVERELAEKALSHAVGDATERAYNRTRLLEKRRLLMENWANYCGGAPAGDNVLPLRRA